jgi:serine/threonine protein kinase
MDYIDSIVSGRYRVKQILGSGSSGQVCLADDLSLGRQVALKLVGSKLSFIDQTTIQRLQREALILSQLDHRNIVNVYSIAVTDDGDAYLSMEYVPGQTLQERLSEERLSLKISLDIAEQICVAMTCAEEHAVVHRDIKPGNVLLSEDESGQLLVKLADFGLAKVMEEVFGGESLTQTNAMIGTVQYMSPEQCLGKPADSRSDIYSFGCTFFEMVFGLPPYISQSPSELIRMHITQSLPKVLSEKRAGVPADLKRIISRCLAKHPSERYQHFRDLLDALQRLKALNVVQGVTASQWKGEAAAVTRPFGRKIKLISIFLGGSVVLFLILKVALGGGQVPMLAAQYISPGSKPAFVFKSVQMVSQWLGSERGLQMAVSTLSTPEFRQWPADQRTELAGSYFTHFSDQKLSAGASAERFRLALSLLFLELSKFDESAHGGPPLSAVDSQRFGSAARFLLSTALTKEQWSELFQPILAVDRSINPEDGPAVALDDNLKIFDELVAEILVHNSPDLKQADTQTIAMRYLTAAQLARSSRAWSEVPKYAARALAILKEKPHPDCEILARVLLAEHAIQQGRMKFAREQLVLCRQLKQRWVLWDYTEYELAVAEATYKRALATHNTELNLTGIKLPASMQKD